MAKPVEQLDHVIIRTGGPCHGLWGAKPQFWLQIRSIRV